MRRVINSFTAGELSPLMAGRLDIADAMMRGCRRLKNFQAHPTGGIFRRSGTWLLGTANVAGSATILFPFQRDADTVFQIEAGDGCLRVWNSDGTLSAVDLVAPWAAADVAGIYYLQSNDVMLLFWDGPPQVLSRTATNWTLAEFTWKYPPLRDENITAVTLSCSVANTGATGALEASADLFEAGHVGSYWQLSHVREEPYLKMDLGEGSGTASAVLTMTAQPAVDEQVKIGDEIYKFVDTPAAKNEVARGGGTAAAGANLIGAITGGTGTYGPGTVAHPDVEAEDAGALAGGSKASAVLTIGLNVQATAQVMVAGVWFTAVASSPTSTQFQIGATPEASLDNIITQANAHPTVAALALFSARIGKSATLTAVTAGIAGNSVTIDRNTGSAPGNDLILKWSNPGTLAGGVATNTERVRVTAKLAGDAGNGLAVSDTLAAGDWSSATLTGGATVTATSSELRVTGKWEVFSVGTWTGKVWLEKKNGAAWEVLRTWTAEGDYNIQTTGEVTTEETLRLRFEGTGVIQSSPTFSAPNPRAQLTALSAEVKGIVKITAVTSATVAQVTVVKPLFLATGETVPAATSRWAEGAFSEHRGWPRAAAFHEQRLVLGGVADEPERLHFSATADLFNFERTGLDDSGFAFDLAATESSPVVTVASMGDGLFVGTESAEWLVKGGTDGRAMTPSSRGALLKNAIGGAGMRPLVFGSRVIFVQAGTKALREFVFDFQDQNYVVPDLTDIAAHLMRYGVRCIAFARKPAPIIYAVTNDGKLLSCLYKREAQLVAWAEHSTAGDDVFEWVSVNSAPGSDDQVWFIVLRGGVRRVERFDPEHFDNLQYAEAEDMLHADSAVTASGSVTEVTGLDHLEGREVVILADGAQQPRKTVVGGKVTLGATFAKVTAGLPYVSEVQPMPVEIPMQDGAASGRMQKAGPLSVHFFRSLALKYADSTDTAHEQRYDFNFRDGADLIENAPPLFTGWRPMSPPAKFRDSVSVVLSTDEPLPLNILALAPTSQVYGA